MGKFMERGVANYYGIKCGAVCDDLDSIALVTPLVEVLGCDVDSSNSRVLGEILGDPLGNRQKKPTGIYDGMVVIA